MQTVNKNILPSKNPSIHSIRVWHIPDIGLHSVATLPYLCIKRHKAIFPHSGSHIALLSTVQIMFSLKIVLDLPPNPIWNDFDFCYTLPCFMFSAKCHNIKWWTQLSRKVINFAMHTWTAATAYMESKQLLLFTSRCRIVVAFDRSPMTITKLHWSQSKGKRPILPCKAKRQYLLTLQVSRYCLLAFESSIRFIHSEHWTW